MHGKNRKRRQLKRVSLQQLMKENMVNGGKKIKVESFCQICKVYSKSPLFDQRYTKRLAMVMSWCCMIQEYVVTETNKIKSLR